MKKTLFLLLTIIAVSFHNIYGQPEHLFPSFEQLESYVLKDSVELLESSLNVLGFSLSSKLEGGYGPVHHFLREYKTDEKVFEDHVELTHAAFSSASSAYSVVSPIVTVCSSAQDLESLYLASLNKFNQTECPPPNNEITGSRSICFTSDMLHAHFSRQMVKTNDKNETFYCINIYRIY